MRGVLSLAAAVSLPFALPDGRTFPQRSVIIYLAFCLIVATLVVQGLTLPLVIRLLGLPEDGEDVHEEQTARLETAHAAIGRLEVLSVTDEAAQILHRSDPSDLDIGANRRRNLLDEIENHQCSRLVHLKSFRGQALTKFGWLVMFIDPPNELFTPRTKVGSLACDRLARSTGRQVPAANEIEMTCQTGDTARSLDFESRLRLGACPDF